MPTQVLKVLGQVTPAASTLTACYTVPASRSAAISSVTICNTTGAAATVRVSIAVGGAADATVQYLYYDLPIGAKDTFIATVGLTLGTGDIVRVWSSAANVAFHVYGSEIIP